MGHAAPELHRGQDRDHVAHHREPHRGKGHRQVPLRRRHAARLEAARLAHRRGQLVPLQEEHARRAQGGARVHQMGDGARADRGMEHRHRLRRHAPGCLRNAEAQGIRERVPAGRSRARPAQVRHRRALHVPDRPREEGARRRDPGGAHRRQVAGGCAESGAARVGETAQTVPLAETKTGTDHVFRIPVTTKTWSVPVLRHVYGWLLLTPAAILLVGFTHYPAAATLVHSLFSTGTAVRPSRFVGLANYAALADDPVFWQVLGNNFWFALGTIPTSIALALLMAIWVNGRLPARALVRMSYFTPTVLPMIAVANLWLYFYTPQIGLLDKVTALFGAGSHNWLGDPHTVMGCLIAMTIWKEAGFFMIFYLAALQALPPELGEAARIEGASRWDFFRRLTFPLLMPPTLVVLVTATVHSFN